jgi:hypothetical protein
VFNFYGLLFGILQILKFCGRVLWRPRMPPRNRATPGPSYAKDEPRWGEEEFERNSSSIRTENVHFKTIALL